MTIDTAAIRARHFLADTAPDEDPLCFDDAMPWPCDAYRTALALDAATKRVARLEAALAIIAEPPAAHPVLVAMGLDADGELAIPVKARNIARAALAAAREALAK